MADDGEAIGTEPAEPTILAQEPVETTELETTQVEGEEGADEEEFDWEGKIVRGPKGLKDAILRQADYTQKTQTLAEQRKALETRQAEIAQQAEVSEKEIEARAALHGVKAELAKFAKLTPEEWAAHRRQDPMGTADAERYEAILRAKQSELEQTLGTATTERTQKAQQEFAKRVEETLAEAPKIIGPGYKGAETITKIAKFLNEDLGVPESVITANWGPVMLKLGHLASIGAEALKRPATKAAAPPPPELKTVTTRSNPGTAALRDDISAEEWVKRRQAQLKKRA